MRDLFGLQRDVTLQDTPYGSGLCQYVEAFMKGFRRLKGHQTSLALGDLAA